MFRQVVDGEIVRIQLPTFEWACDGCGKIIKINPRESGISGRGIPDGWTELKTGGKITQHLCEKCIWVVYKAPFRYT